jgi:tRNA (guanine-N7-)-methyltransferase
MVKVRVRQHVNPLSLKYKQPIQLPDWSEVYSNLNQPLHLDLGSARGQFLLSLAQRQSDRNFLGIEIRDPLVTVANLEVQELGLTNLCFFFGNANNYLTDILTSIPELNLQCVTIQFPDPWFKKRHDKRRIVQNNLVIVLLKYLQPGGIIFLQSDVEKVALEMSDRFLASPDFNQQFTHSWLENNPFSIATEREKLTLSQNQQVYRALIEKKS